MKNIKFLFQSKTIVLNLTLSIAGVVSYFWEPAKEIAQDNGAFILACAGIANVLLRRLTHQAYAFFPVIIGILCLTLPSCAPSTYNVNTQPYAQQIKEHPEKVTMSVQDVKPINKFNIDASIHSEKYGVSAKYTPQGGFSTGINIDTILNEVDQTSGK